MTRGPNADREELVRIFALQALGQVHQRVHVELLDPEHLGGGAILKKKKLLDEIVESLMETIENPVSPEDGHVADDALNAALVNQHTALSAAEATLADRRAEAAEGDQGGFSIPGSGLAIGSQFSGYASDNVTRVGINDVHNAIDNNTAAPVGSSK